MRLMLYSFTVMNPFSIYLHIPFCVHRCAYCDFNTYAGMESLIPVYVAALRREIELAAESAGSRLPVHTVFFGGGTPSLLDAAQVGNILRTISNCYELYPDAEITLEANPGTLSLEQLRNLRTTGVNRISMGMQSSHPDELKLLERQHGLDDVVQSASWARTAGFDNLSLDLIFGIPYQTQEMWAKTLDAALAIGPDHFSMYALTLEHGTPMQKRVELRFLPEPDPDLAADMYELASERMESNGFVQYEISNWGKRQSNGDIKWSRHNLQYWRSLPYLGFGAGAHGCAAGYRTANVLSPERYISRLEEGKPLPFPRTQATAEFLQVTREDEIGEMMITGLRLVDEGVSSGAFRERFGIDLSDRFQVEIERLIEWELLEWSGERLRLTRRGRLLGNRVFMEFL